MYVQPNRYNYTEGIRKITTVKQKIIIVQNDNSTVNSNKKAPIRYDICTKKKKKNTTDGVKIVINRNKKRLAAREKN